MKVLHLNAGNETGGGMFHILSLLDELNSEDIMLGVFEHGEMKERAERMGIRTVLFQQSNRWDFRVLRDMKRFILKHGIDIVHTHGPRAAGLMKMVKKQVPVRWVLTLHSDPHDDFMGSSWKGTIYKKLYLSSIREADHCIAISDRFQDILIGEGVPEERISIVLNGIDFEKKLPQPYRREDWGLQSEDFAIGMVARLEKVKQHELALEAVAKLNANVHLYLIGDGSRKDELKRLARNLGVSDRVNVLGRRDDVDQILPMMDVVLLTSKSESFPLVLLEAARVKVPVITTDVGGVEKLVPDKRYGWIVGQSAEGVVGAIKDAERMKRSGKLKEVGKRINIHAKTNFSITHFADSVYNVYKEGQSPHAVTR